MVCCYCVAGTLDLEKTAERVIALLIPELPLPKEEVPVEGATKGTSFYSYVILTILSAIDAGVSAKLALARRRGPLCRGTRRPSLTSFVRLLSRRRHSCLR